MGSDRKMDSKRTVNLNPNRALQDALRCCPLPLHGKINISQHGANRHPHAVHSPPIAEVEHFATDSAMVARGRSMQSADRLVPKAAAFPLTP